MIVSAAAAMMAASSGAAIESEKSVATVDLEASNHRPVGTGRFSTVRLRYKAVLDAARVIAQKNAERLKNGGQLTEEQRSDEVRAIEDLEAARQALLEATSRLDH
jgi:hypothetical protein